MINCGGEARHFQTDDVYENHSKRLTVVLGKEVARRRIPAFIETSTAHVYKPGSSPRKEDDKLAPWNKLAKWKLEAADELRTIPNLQYCALRLPFVYGAYEQGYFAMGICFSAIQAVLKQDMYLLNNKKSNTLHVRDAASALFAAAKWRASAGSIDTSTGLVAFNVVDHNNTSHGDATKALAEVFNLKIVVMSSVVGSVVSHFTNINVDEAIDEMNEDGLQAWADLIEKAGITRPGPIGPYLEPDLLKDKDMSINGTKFETTTGWKPAYPKFGVDSIREMVDSYKRMGWWPLES